jgi:hypothetical protein
LENPPRQPDDEQADTCAEILSLAAGLLINNGDEDPEALVENTNATSLGQ